jgi:hypothetical protein
MRKLRITGVVITLLLFRCSSTDTEEIRMNEIQVIGSHNSYKQQIEEPLLKILLAKDSGVSGLDYFHIPIKEQLDLGLRSLEIDVLHDPEGGRYKDPVGLQLLQESGERAIPYDTIGRLSVGGLKVLHVPDIDFRSHCLTFKDCLSEVKEWSVQNNDHLPIIITINPKTSGLKEPGATQVLSFTKQVLDSLDQEILSMFSMSELISPDVVKGESASLREAVTTRGWPSLDSSKGKILFVLDAGRAITSLYTQEGVNGKPMFPNVAEDDINAAFFIMNEPKEQRAEIQRMVKAGFMVRTRADADTKEARNGDLSRLESAIASGAHVISTDYYLARLSPTGKFQISLQNGKYASCNPVISSSKCSL